MSELWFEHQPEDLSRRGENLLFAVRPGEVLAVLTEEPLYPNDLALENRELLGAFGAAVHGIGHLLIGAGVPLPPNLTHWSTVPDVPMADLGGWTPTLISIDDKIQLALNRDFDPLQAVATTWLGRHVVCIAPSSEKPVRLVRGDFDARDVDAAH
jgi:hypothetical protein